MNLVTLCNKEFYVGLETLAFSMRFRGVPAGVHFYIIHDNSIGSFASLHDMGYKLSL